MVTFDISMPIRPSMPTFPGDPPTAIDSLRSIALGDPYNLSVLSMGTHSGTHVDSPSHFLAGGVSIDQLDLGLLNGPCRVVSVPAGRSSVFPSDLEGVPPGTQRLLFRTANSERWERGEGYFSDFVDLSPAAAAEVLRRGVRLVGIDALSIEADPTVTFPVHRALLSQAVVILEGLVMANVRGVDHSLRCLPPRIDGGDGGPCRAILDST
jgi:arylformamidase